MSLTEIGFQIVDWIQEVHNLVQWLNALTSCPT